MFFAHPQPKNTKFAKIELKICNKLQDQARIRPNLISGPKSMRFYSKKSLFQGGVKKHTHTHTHPVHKRRKISRDQ